MFSASRMEASRIAGFLALCGLVIARPASAANSLFFIEAQGIAGYSGEAAKAVYYSMEQMDAMQKPSLGFDYVRRFSRETGDFASLAVQARLAWNAEGDERFEGQLYNAYLKLKAGFADVWIGHNRPEFGLSSYFDSHGLLLETLAMRGFGFDRDWGAGARRDMPWGTLGLSVTAGSGMPLEFEGNYLMSARVSRGVLERDNYAIGLSGMTGETLETKGIHAMSEMPMEAAFAGADAAWLRNNLEARLEVIGGERNGESAVALFSRIGAHLLDEGRLRLELQPAYVKEGSMERGIVSVGASYLATPDLTLRALLRYDGATDESFAAFQIYYYRRVELPI